MSSSELFEDTRIQDLLDVILELADGNLDARATPSAAGDDLDAVITGLNMLADELAGSREELEQEQAALRAANRMLVRRERALNDALAEREVLIREIYHRVKNNLQVISSLIKLQMEELHDVHTRALFLDMRNRIQSMALIHERLYQSENLVRIDMHEYISALMHNLVNTYHGQTRDISIHHNVDNISLAVDTAVLCGLIINELVTNAFKHAFPEDADQEDRAIHTTLYADDKDTFVLCVRDTGTGIPPDVDIGTTTTLGLQLVDMLVDQLGGSIDLFDDEGTVISIHFSELEYIPRR